MNKQQGGLDAFLAIAFMSLAAAVFLVAVCASLGFLAAAVRWML